MGSSFSRIPLTIFELINELYIALGAGIWGIGIILSHGMRNERIGGPVCLSLLTAGSLYFVFHTQELHQPSRQKVIVITGCDSGLGYSFAIHLQEMGFTVLAGCLNHMSDGAKQLDALGIRRFDINVTSNESIEKAVNKVTKVLHEDIRNELWALINNAGIMVFAEFEWQTDELMFDQINVNLIGTMRVTKGFAPLLRKYQSRLINISSHCALESLPGLSIYGATKAAVKGFTDALRVELRKYGVSVIGFIPGSFPTQSNILAKQMNYVYEMRSSFTDEQEEFYGDYFQRYNSYLSAIVNPSSARKLPNPVLYQQLGHALLAKSPKHIYKIEPLRYYIYHTLFKLSPISLRDYFVEMFVRMPKYIPRNTTSIETIAQYQYNFDPENSDFDERYLSQTNPETRWSQEEFDLDDHDDHDSRLSNSEIYDYEDSFKHTTQPSYSTIKTKRCPTDMSLASSQDCF